MVRVALQSVAGYLALLHEQDYTLATHALSNLNHLVDQFWPEVADEITTILYEDVAFPERKLAALVASKVYYHLGDYDESLKFSLGAQELFDLSYKSEYVETMISRCIDKYTHLNSELYEADKAPSQELRKEYEGLHTVVERMFDQCFLDGEYKQALGVALDSKRIDIVKRVLDANPDDDNFRLYLLEVSTELVQDHKFRHTVVSLLAKSILSAPKLRDYFTLTRCALYLGDVQIIKELLSRIADMGDDYILKGYQIAFDVNSSASQKFLDELCRELPNPPIESSTQPANSDANQTLEIAENAENSTKSELQPETEASNKMDAADAIISAGVTAENSETPLMPNSDRTISRNNALNTMHTILSGKLTTKLYLEFLYRNNKTDRTILNKIRDSLEARNSIFHSALTFANAFMNAGTTSDNFFRSNIDWLQKANNWSKFSATAALGVIHKGHTIQGRSLLSPYLPGSSNPSPYSEGGSLYALGLIHANHGGNVRDYLVQQLKTNQDEIVQHGAALGLGVAEMGSGDEQLYEELRNVLYSDAAVAGEAAGISMGLVMVGTSSEKAIEEMLIYAHETQHEKIVRGIALGVALLVFGKEEDADTLIDQFLSDQNAVIRYGGPFAIAFAYCGTNNTKAINRLLHVAVSDASDDVRRVATMCLGFILFRTPAAVPPMVKLLSESYNPHLRYGAAMALGISCAGTGLPKAVEILQRMTKDTQDFVRQGAMIALAMTLIQFTEGMSSSISTARKEFSHALVEKHEDALAKFGATIAQGIIDAGGRNVTINMQATLGMLNSSAVIGMAIFTQYWYWYPLTHFLSLAFVPTTIIGITPKLQVPKLRFHCFAKPGLFAYPPHMTTNEHQKIERVETAVLSTTVKARYRALRDKEKEKIVSKDQVGTAGGGEAMDTEKLAQEHDGLTGVIDADVKMEDAQPSTIQPTMENKSDSADAFAKAPEEVPIVSMEPTSTDRMISGEKNKKSIRLDEGSITKVKNMSRVLPAQIKHIVWSKDCRYLLARKLTNGIIVLKDIKPDEPDSYVEFRISGEQ